MDLSFKTSKTKFIWMGIVAAFELAVTIIGKAPLWVFFLALAASMALIITDVTIKEKYQWLVAIIMLVLGAFLTVFLAQYIILDPENLFRIRAYKLMLNVLLILAFYIIVMIISNHTAITFYINHIFFIFWGFGDYFLYQFRENEMTYADIIGIGTGISVASNYDMKLHPRGAVALMITAIFFIIAWKLRVRFKKRLHMSVISALGLAFCVLVLALNNKGINTETWEQKGTYKNGFYLNMMLGIRDSFVSEPDGYDVEKITALEEVYTTEKSQGTVEKDQELDENAPTIIAIMSESYCDLSVIGPLQTNLPLTPFMDSLSENTLRGYALSSVYGAKTPNSEWEFLTGNTMAFLPAGSVVYQQYIQDDATSLVSLLKNRGYTCVAMHPYYEAGWSRNSVYPKLGFDEMYFLDDFPQEKIIREYVSDEELFEQIIKRYEEKGEDERLFMMNITMQNHGGYTNTYPNFTENVYKIGHSYTDANQYLSLIHESDAALEMLINYFRSVDEPVEIVFFGDHQPGLTEDFYTILNGKGLSNLTMEEQQELYKVPFFIWTNYETPAETVELTSLNYLSSYALERAGLELGSYESFLKDCRKVIPAINSQSYYSIEEGRYKLLEEATGEEAEWISKYQELQYNSMFDEANRSEIFFPYYQDE